MSAGTPVPSVQNSKPGNARLSKILLWIRASLKVAFTEIVIAAMIAIPPAHCLHVVGVLPGSHETALVALLIVMVISMIRSAPFVAGAVSLALGIIVTLNAEQYTEMLRSTLN